MDKRLNEPKTLEPLVRQLRHIENQTFKLDLARLIEAAQPEPVEIPQEQPLLTE